MNLVEMRCLYDAPGVLNDRLFVDALRATKNGISLKTLNIRLQLITDYLNLPRLDNQLLSQWRKVALYSIQEFSQPIRPPKKFSGYIKSPSGAGSKSRKSIQPDPGIFEWTTIEEIDFYTALTVGELYLGKSLVIRLPDDDPKIGSKRSKPKEK